MADKTPDQILKETSQTVEILKDAFMSLGASIKENLNKNLVDADGYTKEYVKTLRGDVNNALLNLGKKSEQLINNQNQLNKGQLSSKEIAKQIESLENKRLKIANNLTTAAKNGLVSATQSRKLYLEIKQAIAETNAELEEQAKHAAKTEEAMGNLGRLAQGVTKIPLVGQFMQTEKIVGAMQETAAKTGSKFATMGAGISMIGKNIVSGVLDPLTLITFLLKQGFKADKQTTELAKSLTLSKLAAAGIRQEFVNFSREIGDTAITTDKLLESFSKLSKQLGFNVPRSKELLKEFTTLTTKIGISEESAAGLSKLTLATGKNARSITTEALGTAQALQSQAGIQLDNREVLEDVGKVSGQLLANFKGNPKAISEAVTQTKLLGTTLQQTKAQAESLLNFESSIDNELKAELLTGKELNLENARMAALKGDQATVAKELANQAMDFNAFSELNVIQQKALAESLGLSADALSDQLLKQQMLGKSKSEVLAIGGEEAAQRLEQLAAQDKFNNAVTKLQDLIGNLVAGPLGTMLDMFASLVSNAAGLAAIIGGTMLVNFMKMISVLRQAKKMSMGMAIIEIIKSAYQSLGGLPGIGLILAGSAAAAGIAYLSSQAAKTETGDDIVGYGARTLVTPQGNVALNNNDTVIAGTKLFKGDDVISYPKNALSLGGGSDNTETNNLLKQLIGTTKENNSKPGVINMDGRAVGSTLVQGSYKLA